MDVAGALFGLLVLSVPMLLIAGAIRVWMGPPVIFRQRRAGLHGRSFTMYKFRTMLESPEGRVKDEARLTRLGSFLRRTSLDELPGLFNVLRGDMSLVGPRPLFVEYLERYNARQARRHEVKPGITGWAQVSGRNALSWDAKLELDVWYVDHWSLWIDVKVLAITVFKVLKRDGINAPGHATAPEFKGSCG